jgi:sec-independent protein translocase protein TatC
MVDPSEAIGKARQAVTQRAELPGMSLMEHLDELRRRIIHSAAYLAVGFFVAFFFRESLYGLVQAPLDHMHIKLNYTHPMDPMNLYLQVALIGGAILASPFILYQVWLFIAPGLYQKERRFVVPFMAATVGLFLGGASFAYFFVFPGALRILIFGFGSKFNPMVTIEDYTGFFLSIILGLGISFELPVLIFFLAMFGIVSPRFLCARRNTPGAAQAEKAPYPAMAPLDEYLIADENSEIALARSAAPASISDGAEVMVLGRRDTRPQ